MLDRIRTTRSAAERPIGLKANKEPTTCARFPLV